MKTFGQLKKEIRNQIWPSGEPEPLAVSPFPGVLSAHDQHFQEALADIAKWVRCEQINVVNVVEFCKTFFKCGMTIVNQPNGKIWRVFTVVNDNFCDPVFYKEVTWPEVEYWGRWIIGYVGQLPPSPSKFPLGFGPADPSTDNKCGRGRSGIWCKHDGNIYMAPWIQSVEKVVIEYNGVKTLWEDGDPVNEEQDYKLAVQLYAQFAHERDYGSPERSAFFRMGMPTGSGGYDKALAELIWTCEDKLKVRETAATPVLPYRNLLNPIVEETGIAPAPTDLVVAHVGNVAGGSERADVSVLAISMMPSAIVSSGDKDLISDYDISIGQYYQAFIAPYYGAYGSGAAANAFWPAPGRGDWDKNSLADWLAFFATPRQRRYYDVCLWPVHFFFYDSETDEPDGYIAGSVQGQWLQAKMLLSPAPWKIVVMYGNPYASGVPAGATWPSGLQLPFKSWGASMVLSAGLPYYERMDVFGLPMIVNGCGGSALAGSANSPISISRFISVGLNGAGRIQANKTNLSYEFIDLAGTIIDSVTLVKPGSTTGLAAIEPGPAGSFSPGSPVQLENAILYPGPPVVTPPAIAAIVVDSDGRQWQYWDGSWH